MTAGQGRTDLSGTGPKRAGSWRHTDGFQEEGSAPENNCYFRPGMHTPHLQGQDLKRKEKLFISAQIKVPSRRVWHVMSGLCVIMPLIWRCVCFNWGGVLDKDGGLQCSLVITAHLNVNLLISLKSVTLSPAVHAGVSLLWKSSSLISPVTLKHSLTHTFCD